MTKYQMFWAFVCLLASATSWAQTPTETKSPAPAEVSDTEQETKDKEREEFYELLMTFADTIDQIDRNYVERVSRRELLEAAIDGALRKLDPYSCLLYTSDAADE